MAPSGRTAANNNNTSKTKTPTTSKTRRRTRQQRKTHFKKKQQQPQEITTSSVLPTCCSSSQDSTKEKEDMEMISEVIDVTNNNSACSTPKGQKFRIPEISTCPPAPKKPTRVLSNCSLRRSPLSFFAPPDLEHFFLAALRDVSV